MALLMLAATTAAYFSGRSVQAESGNWAKRWAACAGVVLFTAMLVFFKTEPFWNSLVAVSLGAPIGLSYYTFKLIGYVTDVSRGDIVAERNFIRFAAYISFFPQIVAGPIQRSGSFLDQMRRAPRPTWLQTVMGIQRILLGYFKKFVVADNLQLLVDFTYKHLYDPGTPLLLGFWLYPLQLYADFSGLTDIANGSALLLGIEAPENFEAPFAASTISEYWRRWHITLTSWLTDYVFSPLTIATRSLGSIGLVFSLIVNMVLIGIWHRLVWAFALFGLLHAFFLSVDALTRRKRQRFYKTHPGANRSMKVLGPVFTFQLVATGLVFFRSETERDIFRMLGHLGQGLSGISQEFATFLAANGRSLLVGSGAYVIMEFADYWRRHEKDWRGYPSLPLWTRWAIYSCTALTLLFVALILISSGRNRNPFVYAIF